MFFGEVDAPRTTTMPPFIPHKRRLSSPPSDSSKSKSTKRPTLFDTVDKPGASGTLQGNKTFLEELNGSNSSSSLSDVSSEAFEDALLEPSRKKRKISHDEADDEVDDEVDWEDALEAGATPSNSVAKKPPGDLELTLEKGTRIGSLTNPHGKKKGPSKIERQIRLSTHCMHVQFLLFHNMVRNGWAADKEVQSILVGQLPQGVKKEFKIWQTKSGLISNVVPEIHSAPARRGREGKKLEKNERNQRDWGKPAEKQENGAPDMSHGDPLIRFLKILAAYWRKRFTVTAPGLRKQGYKPLATLEEEIASFRTDEHDLEEHGERIEGVQSFRKLAKICEGSRDVGAQLFIALIRGLGLECRLVASLQPVGFGWSKNEEASARKKYARKRKVSSLANHDDTSDTDEDSNGGEKVKTTPQSKSKAKVLEKGVLKKISSKSRGAKDAPIDISGTSDNESAGLSEKEDDDESLIDITPSVPRSKPNMNYDRDMPAPTYWAEVISPITNEVYPVDSLVLSPAVATNADHYDHFEPRGAKADKAKQVFAYIVAHSPDGTAKDVTTRYLKRRIWPGRTKGVRVPIEKVPVYNKKGKIKYHEEYDWFKTVMSGYVRTDMMRTALDDLEEIRDLKAVKPEKKEIKAKEDTLQGYKTSAEFVLERHLRREEALLPGSNPVKTFSTGKGDKAKEEPVYRRKDVEICRTGESWHKEGRAVKAGEHPMKMVPVRAVTLTRKREVEEAERDGGEKLKQGLYAWNQTDWIIPPPIEDGVIPKNAFGNMDCYVPTMVPKGAVHIPLRSTVRICKRLGIDFAEAVTGFEFGKQRAVPVITGVVVAEENEHVVIDQWEKDEEERRIKEEGKRERLALATWRKWLMGLRIVQRVREEYGGDADAHMKEEMNPFTNQSRAKSALKIRPEPEAVQESEAVDQSDEDMAGGFLADTAIEGGGFFAEGHDEEEVLQQQSELTIVEDGEHPNEQSIPANEEMEDSSDQSKPDGTEERLVKPHVKATPTTSGRGPSKDIPKKGSTAKKTIANRKTREASPLSDFDDELLGASKKRLSNGRLARPAPIRQAARKSKTAVRSHYFDHDDDNNDEDGRDGNSQSEESPPKKPVKKKGRPAGSSGGRSLRARKSM